MCPERLQTWSLATVQTPGRWDTCIFSTPALRWHAPECRSTHLEIQKPYGSVDTQPLQQQCGPCKRAGQSLPTPGGSILGQLPRHRGRMAVHVAPTSVSGLKQLPVPSQAADPCAHQHGGTLLGWGMLRAFPLKREIAFCAQVSKGVALMTVKLRNFTKNKKRDQVGQGSLLEVPSTKDWGICS